MSLEQVERGKREKKKGEKATLDYKGTKQHKKIWKVKN